jgi:hypothetical protein
MFEMILKLHEVMNDSYYNFLDLKISITNNLHYHISSPLILRMDMQFNTGPLL